MPVPLLPGDTEEQDRNEQEGGPVGVTIHKDTGDNTAFSHQPETDTPTSVCHLLLFINVHSMPVCVLCVIYVTICLCMCVYVILCLSVCVYVPIGLCVCAVCICHNISVCVYVTLCLCWVYMSQYACVRVSACVYMSYVVISEAECRVHVLN